MATVTLPFPAGQDSSGQDQGGGTTLPLATTLCAAIDVEDAAYTVGTCPHCVLDEQGRPDRAWEPNGDRDLDFDREQYFALLAKLGLVLTDREAYICP